MEQLSRFNSPPKLHLPLSFSVHLPYIYKNTSLLLVSSSQNKPPLALLTISDKWLTESYLLCSLSSLLSSQWLVKQLRSAARDFLKGWAATMIRNSLNGWLDMIGSVCSFLALDASHCHEEGIRVHMAVTQLQDVNIFQVGMAISFQILDMRCESLPISVVLKKHPILEFI